MTRYGIGDRVVCHMPWGESTGAVRTILGETTYGVKWDGSIVEDQAEERQIVRAVD